MTPGDAGTAPDCQRTTRVRLLHSGVLAGCVWSCNLEIRQTGLLFGFQDFVSFFKIQSWRKSGPGDSGQVEVFPGPNVPPQASMVGMATINPVRDPGAAKQG